MRENIYETYMEKVISCMDNVELDSSLFDLDNILAGKDLKSIINGQVELEKCYKFLSKKLEPVIKYRHGFYDIKIDRQDVLAGASILKTAKYIIMKAANEADTKALLKGIMILRFFNFPFSKLLCLENISVAGQKELLVELEEIISAFHLEVKNTNKLLYSDIRYYEEFETGIKEKNMKKVYDFIEALERGRGYLFNSEIEDLIKFTYILDSILLKKITAEKNSPLEIAMILNVLDEKEKLEMALGDDVNNEWVLVGVIHQTLGKNCKRHLSDEMLDKIHLILGQLRDINQDFFFQCVSFFANYEDFNYALGVVLARSEKGIILKYIETFRISEYRGDLENDRLFIESFIKEADQESSLLLCSKMYEKWICYLDSFQREKKYLSELFYTNCFYMIVYYFLLRRNEQEEVLREIEVALMDIENINYIWCENSTEIGTRFFTKLTYLYLLSLECKEKDYKLDLNLREKVEAFLRDERLWLYYFDMTIKPGLIEEMEHSWLGVK